MEIRSGVSPTGIVDEKGAFPFYKVEQLNYCQIELGETPYKVKHASIPRNSIVFPKRGAAIMTNKIRIASRPCQLDTNLMALSIKNAADVDYRFVFYYIERCNLSKIADTSTIPQINNIHINPLRIVLPTINEQSKISRFISVLDERISTQIKVIEGYKSLITTIIQRSHHHATREVLLRDILTERKELNSKGYDVHSVSVSKGVINQVEYLGRSFAAKDTAHYHVVHKGDIVYTKSPTGDFPYGIIKQSYIESPVAVSPLYGVYEPCSFEIGVFLNHYFCNPKNVFNYLHKLIQKGAKNTINITNQHFLDNTIRVPEESALKRLVSCINSLTQKVSIEEGLLNQYEQLKSYILKNMII